MLLVSYKTTTATIDHHRQTEKLKEESSMTKIVIVGSRRVSILAVLLLVLVWTAGRIDNADASGDGDDDSDGRHGMEGDYAPTAASAVVSDEQDDDSIIPEAQIIETIEGLKRRIESDLIAEIGSVSAGGATTEGEDGIQQQQASMMKELDTKLDALKQKMKRLEEVYIRYNNKQKETMRLIHEANEVQLQTFVQRLDDTLEKELSLRERRKTTTTAEIDDSVQDGVDVVTEDDEILPPPPEVTMKTLQEQLNIDEILEESESEITSWILQIAKHELDTFQHKTLAAATSAMKKKLKKQMMTGDGGTTAAHDDDEDGTCPTTGQIVEQVQVSLNKYADDGIGLVDYASQQSTTTTVVSMMTSETFQPPSNQKLGSAWFRSFIPEDWERHLLPDGWEEWNFGIPDYVYHSLVCSLFCCFCFIACTFLNFCAWRCTAQTSAPIKPEPLSIRSSWILFVSKFRFFLFFSFSNGLVDIILLPWYSWCRGCRVHL